MSMDTEKTLRRGRKLIMRTEGWEDKDVKTVWGSREKCRNGMRAEAKKNKESASNSCNNTYVFHIQLSSDVLTSL